MKTITLTHLILVGFLCLGSCSKDTPTSPAAASQPVTAQSKPSTPLSQTSRQSIQLTAQDGHGVTVISEDNNGATIDSVLFEGGIYIPQDTLLLIPKDQTGNLTVYISHKPWGYFVVCFMYYSSIHAGEDMANPDNAPLPTDSCTFENVISDSLTNITLQRGP